MPDYNTYYKKFITVIGRQDLAEDENYFPVQNMQSNKLGEKLYDIVMEAIGKKTLEEWNVIFREADIPFAPAQNWMEIMRDPQAEANNCFYDMTYDNGNVRRLVRLPVKFEEMGNPDYKRGPFIGEQGNEILKELGYDDKAIAKLLEDGDIYIYEKK